MKVINYLLGYKNLKIYQDTDMFNFSLDSILLPNFVTLKSKCENILDIGSGNAVIPIILSTKTKASIIGVEIQKTSYELGIESIKLNKLENRITLINDDINNFYKNCESDTFDVITCNPPYFRIFEGSKLNSGNSKSLARHEISLTLETIFKTAKKLLKNNGVIAIVHRPDRLVEILETMRNNNIEPKKIRFVYPKLNKSSNMILVEGSKNGKPGLKIESPLIVHTDDNSYSDEVLKYFK